MRFDKLTGHEFAEDKDFMNKLIASTKNLFNSPFLIELFSHNDHVIKGHAYTDKSGEHHMYLLEKKGSLFSVYKEDIPSYELEKGLPSIKSFFSSDVKHWKTASKQGEDVKIYLPFIFQETERNFSTNISQKDMEEMLKRTDLEDSLKNVLLKIKELYDTPAERGISATSSIGYMKKYADMLKALGFMEAIDKEFYKQKSLPFTLSVNAIKTDIIGHYKRLKEQCIANGFQSQESAYVFNDYDNSLWVEDGKLYLKSQNTCFECVEESNIVKCYLLDVMNHSLEDELEKIKNKRENKEIDLFSDITLIFNNDSIIYADNALMECIWCDLKYSSMAFDEEGFESVKYPEDIKTFSYQQQFMCERYGKSKLDFLVYNFLSLGTTSYDPVNKALWDNGIFYKEMNKVDEPENDTKMSIQQVFYVMRDDVKELNDDWKEGLRFLLESLKTRKYLPTMFHYHEKLSKDDPEKSLDVIIESIESWFKKYDNIPAKKTKI